MHREKVSYVDIAEAFKENKKDIEDLSVIFDEYEEYLSDLKEDIRWSMDRLTGKSLKEKEIIEEMLLGCVDVISFGYQQLAKEHRIICGIISPAQNKGKGFITPQDVEVARSYPIENLVNFKNGFSRCIFHNEKTASMKHYEDSNTVYCFGCHEFADSIGVYMQLNGVDFLTAVRQLSNGNN